MLTPIANSNHPRGSESVDPLSLGLARTSQEIDNFYTRVVKKHFIQFSNRNQVFMVLSKLRQSV